MARNFPKIYSYLPKIYRAILIFKVEICNQNIKNCAIVCRISLFSKLIFNHDQPLKFFDFLGSFGTLKMELFFSLANLGW